MRDARIPAAPVPGGCPTDFPRTLETAAMSDPMSGLTLATTPTVDCDRLDQLLSRIADGDRAAFRRLYAFMAMRVWQMATATPLGDAAALAVTTLTFVEVWHSAGAAARYDARDWIAAVTAGRVNDRLRTVKVNGRHSGHLARLHATADGRHSPPTVDDYDRHLRRELTALLGGDRATIRTSPGVFVRIDDLDDALVTIAAAGIPSRASVPGRATAPRSAVHTTTVRRQ